MENNTRFRRVILEYDPDEEQDGQLLETGAPDSEGTQPDLVGDQQAGEEDDDLLIIQPRPAERRAEDFLPGWMRRFSRV